MDAIDSSASNTQGGNDTSVKKEEDETTKIPQRFVPKCNVYGVVVLSSEDEQSDSGTVEFEISQRRGAVLTETLVQRSDGQEEVPPTDVLPMHSTQPCSSHTSGIYKRKSADGIDACKPPSDVPRAIAHAPQPEEEKIVDNVDEERKSGLSASQPVGRKREGIRHTLPVYASQQAPSDGVSAKRHKADVTNIKEESVSGRFQPKVVVDEVVTIEDDEVER